MEQTLGRFGDRRLEKGGPFFWDDCWREAVVRFGFVGLVATVQARCGSRGSSAIRR